MAKLLVSVGPTALSRLGRSLQNLMAGMRLTAAHEILQSQAFGVIAVGTGITPRPPHGSVQALLRHTALTLSG
jgi:hypothetical protein